LVDKGNEKSSGKKKVVDLSAETKRRLGKIFHSKAPWFPTHLKGRELAEHYGFLSCSKWKHFSERLHCELVDLADYLSPTVEEEAARSLVVRKCDAVVRRLFPGKKIASFGSFETGLYLPTSDIDLVVTSASKNDDIDDDDEYVKPPLRKLARALIKAGIADPRTIQVISHARVPIIKFTDRLTGHAVDISFNIASGLDGARFLKEQLKIFPALRPLLLFLKLFLDLRGLNEVFRGGLGSFSAACLLISFFQLHPLIQLGYLRPEDNLGILLIEFLELYGKLLNYDRVGISVGIDLESLEVFHQAQQEQQEIDTPFGYYDKMDRGFYNESRPGLLSIQDPQSPTNDLARPSFSISSVKQALEHAFNLLTAAAHEIDSESSRANSNHHGYNRTDGSLLAALIEIPEKFLKHREYIKRTISVK
jgi:non-canonical poly(A) RNA polymerase PAPD5/7